MDLQNPSIKEALDYLGFTDADMRFAFSHNPEQPGLTVTKNGKDISITYSETAYLFRALGLAVEHSKEDSFTLHQSPRFDTNGIMADCSRNAVMSVETVKTLIKQMALMGHNRLMLYTEDTYEVENHPYFGYMRGRYTSEELQLLDSYAASFGIELIPCIQTLAHMSAALRWPCYAGIIDCEDILLADDENTYAFLEDLIKSCRKGFTSRHINIGMDEAWLLGRGKFHDKNGCVDRFEIMCKHLNRVIAICEKYDFKPMMWSDTFFNIINGSYYGEGEIDQKYLDKVPAGVELIYWDYYATEKSAYERNMAKHKQFHNNVLFAGGAWRWCGIVPSNIHSLKVSQLAMDAAEENGIREIFTTAWGDNGAEASIFSILPSLCFYAEYNFNPHLTEQEMAQRFKACTKGDFYSFLELDKLDHTEGYAFDFNNPSKYLFFNDVMIGLFDKHVGDSFPQYFADMAKKLAAIADSEPNYGYLFDSLAKLGTVLSLKCDIGLRLKRAYDDGDRETLASLAQTALPAIADAVREFKAAMQVQWEKENKIFGYEVLDNRIGGVLARLDTSRDRLLRYANGQLNTLEELEEDRLYFDCRNEPGDRKNITHNLWHRMISAGVVAGI